MTVGVKANLVARMGPESAAVTHPECLAALTRLLVRRGARVIVGDSPGGPFTAAWVHSVYNGAGVRAVEAAGGKLNENLRASRSASTAAKARSALATPPGSATATPS